MPELGIHAIFARSNTNNNNNNKEQNNSVASNSPQQRRNFNDTTEISMMNRNYKTTTNGGPQRINIPSPKPVVTEKHYKETKLGIVDPNREFLQNDIHTQHNIPPTPKSQPNSKKATYGGRTYFKENQELVKQLRQVNMSMTNGHFNEQTQTYTYRSNETISLPEFKKCVYCGKDADKLCQRCRDPYCSKDCQRADFIKHRPICFEMPPLVCDKSSALSISQPQMNIPQPPPRALQSSVKESPKGGAAQPKDTDRKSLLSIEVKCKKTPTSNEVVTNGISNNMITPEKPRLPKSMNLQAPRPIQPSKPISPPIDEFPKSNSTVTITSVANPRVVTIRCLSKAKNVGYIKVLGDINENSKTAPMLNKIPERGDIVLSLFNDGEFYRAMILDNTDPEKIRLVFIDFGNQDIKMLKDLRELDPKLQVLTRYAHVIKLDGIDETISNPKVIEYLMKLSDDTVDLKLVYKEPYDPRTTEIELIEVQKNESVNMKIKSLLNMEKPKATDEYVKTSVSIFIYSFYFYPFYGKSAMSSFK